MSKAFRLCLAWLLGWILGLLISTTAFGKEPPMAVVSKEPPIARVPPMAVVREIPQERIPVVVIPSYQPKPLTQSTVVSGVTTNRPFTREVAGQFTTPRTIAQIAERVNITSLRNAVQPTLTLVPGVRQFGITNCTSYG